jgi:hypothetical protein
VSASFERWVEAVFDHPICDPEWYWDDDFNVSWEPHEMTASLTVEYMTRLFSAPDDLRRYSLEQVAQGIWFMVGESSPGKNAHALLNPEVSLGQRTRCIRSVARFFEKFVAPAAPTAVNTDNDPFHIACYMWWDIFPTYDGTNSWEPELYEASLTAMSETLLLPSELCQLSALHGLNHWHEHHAEKVEAIIDGFVQKQELTHRIRSYAALARMGTAQ